MLLLIDLRFASTAVKATRVIPLQRVTSDTKNSDVLTQLTLMVAVPLIGDACGKSPYLELYGHCKIWRLGDYSASMCTYGVVLPLKSSRKSIL